MYVKFNVFHNTIICKFEETIFIFSCLFDGKEQEFLPALYEVSSSVCVSNLGQSEQNDHFKRSHHNEKLDL